MHWIIVWWRQPDHYQWLSDYLDARGLQPRSRFLAAINLATLATATALMLTSPSGPQTSPQRAAATVAIVGFTGIAVNYLLRWPTRTESEVLSVAGTLGIVTISLIERDPGSGMLGCAGFGGLAGYVAFFHSARLLVFTLGAALGAAAVCAGRIALDGDPSMAVAKWLVLGAGILAVTFCGQILVHWLSVDASKSSTDPLTGLRNRRGFYRAVPKLLSANDHPQCLSVLMIDLDNFKGINDTYGHATGDRILVAVADTLRRIADAGTVIARVGGEEFLVAQRTGLRQAVQSAEAMREAIASTPWDVTASLGVSSTRLPAETLGRKAIEGLVEAADAAMYEAKRAGGNRVRRAEEPARP